MKFLILSLNLCVASEAEWDNGACTGGLSAHTVPPPRWVLSCPFLTQAQNPGSIQPTHLLPTITAVLHPAWQTGHVAGRDLHSSIALRPYWGPGYRHRKDRGLASPRQVQQVTQQDLSLMPNPEPEHIPAQRLQSLGSFPSTAGRGSRATRRGD